MEPIERGTNRAEAEVPGAGAMGDARRSEGSSRARRSHAATRYAVGLLLALVLAWLAHATAFETYRVVSESMTPALRPGDHVLVDKIVFGATVPLLGVRLPALREPRAGDVLLFRHPDDPARVLVKRCAAVGGAFAPFARGGLTVPENMLFVLGDNRERSSDSREWGFLPREQVIGRAARVVWSAESDGVRWARLFRAVR